MWMARIPDRDLLCETISESALFDLFTNACTEHCSMLQFFNLAILKLALDANEWDNRIAVAHVGNLFLQLTG